MKFREATVADIPAMSKIRLAVKENTLSNPNVITDQMYKDYLDKCGKGWVCEIHGKVVCFSYAASEDNSIWALFVNPNYEGMGLGKQLLKLAIDWLFERGTDCITLETAINTRADHFYKAQGWVKSTTKNREDVIYTLYKSTR
ncbi:MAG: GNAT family N-acetyltransferase [Plesiomonas sp.]|uniref:GNAT family N-acetyltransferase n=1 Tax=Plesiomonas sp. TaxID=2486279 RepID=UPI003F2BDA85